MNIVLWIVQAILAVKCLSTAFVHGLRQDKQEMREGIQKMGRVARPLLFTAAFFLLLGSVGLVAPALADLPGWLAPVSAGGLGVMMLASIPLHLKGREKAKIFADVILFVLCAFVAYGRWVIAPF